MHNPWYYGEHLVYDTADFDVTVTFTDGSSPQVASSGAEVASGSADSRRFTLEAGRTFALSISTLFKVATRQVGDVTVYAYYFAFYDAPGEAMLQTTVEAMQVFTEKFGTVPPQDDDRRAGRLQRRHGVLGVLFHQPRLFQPVRQHAQEYLVIIAAHETAHQWWFDAVADNQALEPWLDETLCTYSERIYYETVHPRPGAVVVGLSGILNFKRRASWTRPSTRAAVSVRTGTRPTSPARALHGGPASARGRRDLLCVPQGLLHPVRRQTRHHRRFLPRLPRELRRRYFRPDGAVFSEDILIPLQQRAFVERIETSM
ncbi:MAG: hypothetical protein MZV64_00165 [Ignavibacteriales bacterium]|nr:hypothetical protein [Ignavibacteriales bacterium]